MPMIERMCPKIPEYSGERAGIVLMVCSSLVVAIIANLLRVM